MEKYLEVLRKDFETHTKMDIAGGIKISGVERVYGWYKLYLSDKLDCDKLHAISNFIRYRFSQGGNYRHLLPAISVFNGALCLTVDKDLVEEVYKDEKS